MSPAFVLPDDAHVGAVTLQVSDLERSEAFYQSVLGFQVFDRAEGDARLGVAGESHALLRLRGKRGVRHVPPRGLLGLYHFAVLLPTRGDLGRCYRHGMSTGVHIGAADHWFSEALYFTDPDGITVEVYRDLPRDAWRYRGGELAGGTDPLDINAILDAAGPEPWRGLPTGTTMGHVHFYVDDLQRASRFYVTGLGFTPTITSLPGALFVSAGGYHHHVGLNTWASGSPVATDDDARLIEWELVLPDHGAMAGAVASLAAAGVDLSNGPDGPLACDPWNLAVRLRATE